MNKNLSLLILATPLLGVSCANNPAPSPPASNTPPTQPAPARVATPSTPTTAKPSLYDAEVKVWGEFTDHLGFQRKYVQVAPGFTDAQIVKIAQKLHEGEPKTWFWMLDDGAQAKQMMEALPQVEKGDNTGYPVKWVKAHTVAHILMQLVPGGSPRYVVCRGAGSDVIAVLK